MATLERALQIAAEAHAGQLDKAGQPYILHPLRVMLAVSGADERIAALLHDVVEDSPVTLDQLRASGFSDEVLAAVDALTKRPGETRLEAATRAAANPVARTVKLADNADNSDLSRLPQPTAADLDRLEEYRAVRRLLLAAEPGVGPHRMPAGLTLQRTTPVFTDTTVPAGLLRAHRVAAGVWGRLRVLEGTVTFVFETDSAAGSTTDPAGAGPGSHPVAAGQWVDIPPEVPHRVEPAPGTRFAVEFHVPPTP